jgi:hypothetical protein
MPDKETTAKKQKNTKTRRRSITKKEPSGKKLAVKKSGNIYKGAPTEGPDERKIKVLKHGFYYSDEKDNTKTVMGVELVVINAIDKTIGSILFKAVFYDMEGDVLDTVEYKAIEFVPNISCTLRIASSILNKDNIKGYQVNIVKMVMVPEPNATGNEQVAILKHNFFEGCEGEGIDFPFHASAKLVIKNVSESTIASAIFKVVFYDIEGNTLETVRHEEVELKPSASRDVVIRHGIWHNDAVKSYDVKLIRTTTTDIEKVQLCGWEMATTKTGAEKITGVVKNISEVKTDAALVATFYNYEEIISTKIVLLRDIEPGSIREFRLLFKPQEGDVVRTNVLRIGDILE